MQSPYVRQIGGRTPPRQLESGLTLRPLCVSKGNGLKVSLGVLALFALLLSFVANAAMGDAAEATTGVIVGTIVDASGKGIPGASISAAPRRAAIQPFLTGAVISVLLGIVLDAYTASATERAVTNQRFGPTSGYYRANSSASRSSSRTSEPLAACAQTTRYSSLVRRATRLRSTAMPRARTSLPHRRRGSRVTRKARCRGRLRTSRRPTPSILFGNALLRGGKVGDAVFEYNSVPIPQGLIAEPGGNVDGAQLPTTGVASTIVTLAGYSNETDNALGGVVNQIPSNGTYPGRATLVISDGIGSQYQNAAFDFLTATPDLKWRYALSATSGSEYFKYGDGQTFYPSEAGTYGLAIQSRGVFSLETNVHYQATPKDDVSFLALYGQAAYDQYASPFAGETVGEFDGAMTTYPGEVDPNAPVDYASGSAEVSDVLNWRSAGSIPGSEALRGYSCINRATDRRPADPFGMRTAFPMDRFRFSKNAVVNNSMASTLTTKASSVHSASPRFGGEFRTNTSYLNQVVPTADEFIASNPTVISSLAYFGDTWSPTSRLDIMGTARATYAHFMPSAGRAYDSSAVDPHFGISYRIGSEYALRANYDHITVDPAPLEVDRTDSANVDENGNPAPFVELAPEIA